MNYILFDDNRRISFLPLAYTNCLCDLLIGQYTNRDRWQRRLENQTSSLTEEYLQHKFPLIIKENNTLINSRLIPDKVFLNELSELKKGEKLMSGDDVLAIKMEESQLQIFVNNIKEKGYLNFNQVVNESDLKSVELNLKPLMFANVWDFFLLNGQVIDADMELLQESDFSSKIGEANQYIGNRTFIHKKAIVNGAILNSSAGPIIIDEGAEVMEGSLIRGPVYLGKYASVKMGAKIYGPTSIGQHSKVGGEINNSVVNAFSNKAHDGFLGNAVIGYWCNLGADSNNSNLKNDYSEVKLWHYGKESFVKSGLQFLGLVMGDHSKCGINTMFNTGTVVGVSCNIYGGSFQANFIPSYSWGKAGAYTTYQFNKAMDVVRRVMDRRKLTLEITEENLLKHIFEVSQPLRDKFNKAP